MCQRQGCGRGDEKTSVAVRPAGATDQPLPPFDHVAARARAARNARGLAFDRHRAVPLECGVRHMQQPRERPHNRQMQKHLRGQACGAPSRAGSAALLLPPPPRGSHHGMWLRNADPSLKPAHQRRRPAWLLRRLQPQRPGVLYVPARCSSCAAFCSAALAAAFGSPPPICCSCEGSMPSMAHPERRACCASAAHIRKVLSRGWGGVQGVFEHMGKGH